MVLKGDSCHNVSFLPEAVQVAVGAGPDNLLAGHEDSEGLGVRGQFFSHHPVLGQQLYPLDIVPGCHGMESRPYGHLVSALDGFNHGDVFLGRGVGGVAFEQFHRLSAAYECAAALVQDFYDIATCQAMVDFSFLCHIVSFRYMVW